MPHSNPVRPTLHGGVRVEIAVESPAGLEIAARQGADRIELAASLDRGGLTPPPELVGACVALRDRLAADGIVGPDFTIQVLIRPRAGTADMGGAPDDEFVYTSEEADVMARQAAASIEAGADGVVIGALTAGPDGLELDVAALTAMVDAARTAAAQKGRRISLTHHRAVDSLHQPGARAEAVRQLVELGFDRVLTSGGADRGVDGAEEIQAMAEAADGRLTIMAAGGVRPADVPPLIAAGAGDVHTSARTDASEPDHDGAPLPDSAAVAALVQAVREAQEATR